MASSEVKKELKLKKYKFYDFCYFFSGLIFSQGELWREQRRFTLRHLRDLGFGKRSMEGLIHDEVSSLLIEVGRMAGPDWAEPVELHDVLGTSGINVLWHVMAGKKS